jgi:uncharacterized protein YndB with AHSA1/START domain
MKNTIIEKSIDIKAPLNKVWSVFTNPDVTKKIGGYYDTDWKVGSSFGFKTMDGIRLTNGTILEYQHERLIKHNLFEPKSEKVIAVITYDFQEKNGVTLLTGSEELTQSFDNSAVKNALEGWEFALNTIKQLAESL